MLKQDGQAQDLKQSEDGAPMDTAQKLLDRLKSKRGPTPWFWSRHVDDSPVGSGDVDISMELVPDAGWEDHPFVNLTIEWEPDAATDQQPDHWKIVWSHGLGVIGDELKMYLRRYCPVGDAAWDLLLAEMPVEYLWFFVDKADFIATAHRFYVEEDGILKRNADGNSVVL